MSEQRVSVTRDELETALGETVRHWAYGSRDAAVSAVWAALGGEDFEPGGLYVDAQGRRFKRLVTGPARSRPWLSLDELPNFRTHPEGVPARPLRRLVPEEDEAR